MSEKKELLSVREVSKAFGLSIRTVQRLSKQGKIKAVKLGRQWKYVKEDVEKYLLLGINLSKNPSHIEKRAYPRINSNFNCQYSINLSPFKEVNNKGIIGNLSAGGVLLFNQDRGIKINDPIDLKFSLFTDNNQNVDISAKGKVVRKDKDGFGIKFKKIDDDIKEIIMEYTS